MSLAQIDHHFPDGIPAHFVLLDSDSTVSIFCNPDLLTDIHDVNESLYLATNGGHQVSTQMGTLPNFGPVWFNPDSIANILSLAQVRAVRRVTMDTAELPAFHVHKLDGSGTTIFAEHPSGLYLYDSTSPDSTNHSNDTVLAYSCLQTVAENQVNFTARQIAAANEARRLHRLLGRPGYPRFLTALKENHILNCPVTVDDARRAELIYGKDVAFLKGKTTASPAPAHVQEVDTVALPTEFLSLYPNVTLCYDLFYVLGLVFSLSVSRDIRFLSCRHIVDRTNPLLKACIQANLAVYQCRGFTPTDIHADGEFSALRTAFPDIRFSICAADAHVPEVERAIRSIKETIRATIHGMPFHHLPRVLVKELAAFAMRNRVSVTMSPATIVTGAPKTDFTTMKLEFGTYVQVYEGTSSNTTGDYFFMSLGTGERIQRRSWTVLPISDIVISRVEAIAFAEEMPRVDTKHSLPEYDPDAVVDISTYDRDFIPVNAPDPESDHALTSDAYTDTSDDDDSDYDDDVGHHPDFDDAVVPRVATTTMNDAPSSTNTDHSVVEKEERTTLITPRVENEDRTENSHGEYEERTAISGTALTLPPTLPPTPYVEPVVETIAQSLSSAETVSLTPSPSVAAARMQPVGVIAPVPTVPEVERKEGLRSKQPASYAYRYGFAQTDTEAVSTANKTIEKMSPPTQAVDGEYTPAQMQSIHKAVTGLMFTQCRRTKVSRSMES
jgi:hypothetical protein